MKQLFGKTIQVLSHAINLRVKRNAVISSNIANIDTPGYKSKDVPFERLMAKYLDGDQNGLPIERTNPRHLDKNGKQSAVYNPLEATSPAGHPIRAHQASIVQKTVAGTAINEEASEVIESRERGTPNNVDLDKEMAKLAVNNLRYQATVQALIKEFELLKDAITEGGKA